MLASRSPQRRAILAQLGVPFEAVSPEVEEATEGEPSELVAANALRKARDVAARRAGRRPAVLGVDTTVALDGEAHGKPADEREARRILARLAGRDHAVWSGIALISGEREATSVTSTRVRFRSLTGSEIEWYVATGEWRERAGGYAIQGRGAALVEAIEGDFWNVVGLPVADLLRLAPGLLVDPAAASAEAGGA